jgi:signal transduction histidine kinase
VGESLDDLRLLSHRLLKHKEDETDIVACLGRECERLRLLKVCDISFRSNSSAVFVDTYLVHTALRILQESLQNSLKHSGCRHICISLENRNDKLVLSVKDDGRGFDMKAATQGVGLRNIKRRADIIGAWVKQESAPGMGTQLKLEIPTAGKQ